MLRRASRAEECTHPAGGRASLHLPPLTLARPCWMHDWEENWSVKASCKSAWKLLGKQSLEESVLLWVAVL